MPSLSVAESVLRDLRYAIRSLRKTPVFTTVALLTLALGIGVNTAVFSVVNALLLEPLPYPEADRLATLRTTGGGPAGTFSSDGGLDGATYLALRRGATTFDVAARGASGWGAGVNLVARDRAANVVQGRVTAGYFALLGVRPFVGREFTADEDRDGGSAAAILSHALWTRVFDGDRTIVGRSIALRGTSYIVVGVMPETFTDGSRTEIWTPLRPSTQGEGQGTNFTLTARLRPGVTWQQASAEAAAIASPALQPQFGTTRITCALVPLQEGSTSDIRRALLMLWGAVALVLLIACVNVAGLLLARAGVRTREIATRLALGSGRTAVVRQLLVESLVLALVGGVAGVALGSSLLDVLKTLGADLFEIGYPVTLDGRVLIASLLLASATSLLFGLAPALTASRVDVRSALAAGGTRSIAGGATGWSRRAFVVTEVAIGVVLLISAGLLLRTFVGLRALAPGFDPAGVVTATVSLQDARYEDPAAVARLFDESLARIRRHPGVEAAGVMLGLPYTRLLNLGFRPVGPSLADQRGSITNLSYITPGCLEALRVPVRAGRTFSDVDRTDSLPVAIVNEEFARHYYGGDPVIGREIEIAGARRSIIGVVGSTRTVGSGFRGYVAPLVTPPIVYVPASQVNGRFLILVHTWFSPSWVVRAGVGPEAVAMALQTAIGSTDPLLPIARLESLGDVAARSLATERFVTTLMLALGALAVLLAALGIHGVMATSVVERTRELGVRLALGATGAQAMRSVVVPGMLLVGVGAAIGVAGALGVTRLLQSFLWGVEPTDPVTFVAAIGTLLVVALVASVAPALRVLRLDPAVTLRAE